MGEDKNWVIQEIEFSPGISEKALHHQETIFTIGNGYLSTRGAFEEGFSGENRATLIHGVFDDAPVVFTELANAPSWPELEILMDGERFSMFQGQILDYERFLDLRTGLLSRNVCWRSPSGKTSRLHFERFASLANSHLFLARVTITPLDYSGKIAVRAGLDGNEETAGLLHWKWLDQRVQGEDAWLHLRTRSTGIELGLAFRLLINGARDLVRQGWDVRSHPTLAGEWMAVEGETVTVEKLIVIFTSRDLPEPAQAALQALRALPDPAWEETFRLSSAAWEAEWRACDVVVEGDDLAQLAIRFNIFQLLIAAPRHDERVSIGAKTLSGFGYRGHVFWDTEIFMLPFFTLTHPDIACNLLSYRWHTLGGARRKAQDNGYLGAQFAWESAATGEEVTPTWVPDPSDRTCLIRIWTGDIEIHVSSDIAYAIWMYWQTTGDEHFMVYRGAEIIFETARFWVSRAEWKPDRNRFEFTNVIGPDEYHDHVDNNAYTNAFAAWHLLKAAELHERLAVVHPAEIAALDLNLKLTGEETEHWKEVAGKIYIPFDPQTARIEQFSGYFERQVVNLANYDERQISMQVLLGIEGVNQTQVIKQPDVLMLHYLLPDLYPEAVVLANYEYYTARTDHTYGSSLGPAIQAIMACRVGRPEEAYEHFGRAARADLYDVRGNAGDGVHGASAGGLWQAVVFGFAGLSLSSGGWNLKPSLPPGWKRLAFKFYHCGQLQEVNILGH